MTDICIPACALASPASIAWTWLWVACNGVGRDPYALVKRLPICAEGFVLVNPLNI